MNAPPSAPPVRRRIVFHLGGYDYHPPAEQHRLFLRELPRFSRNWSISATASAAPEIDELTARWTVCAEGPNWHCTTSYRVWRWDDIVRRELGRNHLRRLWRALVAWCDFVGTGTVWRYFRSFWPVTIFFGFAYALLGVFALTGTAAGLWLGGGLGWATGLAVFSVLYLATAHRWRLAQALDLWSFARDYARGRQAATEQHLEYYLRDLLAAMEEPDTDEILVVGHSFGTLLAVDLLARALARRPDLGRRSPPIRLLTVGSMIAQIGLHPRGTRTRAAAAAVAASAIDWAEYHACDDALSFYKIDPVTLQPRRDYPPGSRPMVRRVHVRDMLSPEIFHRFRHRWIRLHYQPLMANDVRAPYDFFMFACGPLPFPQIVAAQHGPADFIDAHGRWLNQPPATPGT